MMIKKVIALILTAVFSLSAFSEAYAKENENNSFGLLIGLGIAAEDEDINTAATRADLARVGLGLINRLNEFDGSKITDIYDDVTEYSSEIYGAYATGIMVGDGSGSFKPNEFINQNMITAVMGRVCGYGALERELWNSFSISEAELYKKVYLSSPITLGELYAVAENCLEAEMLSLKLAGGEGKTYEKSEETVLEYYFDAYEGEGIVSSNSVSGLVSSTMRSRVDTVVINNITYDVGNTNAFELFGLNCEFYYVERDGDDPQLIYIKKDKKAEMLTIDSKDVLSYTNKRYAYATKQGARKLSKPVSESADILYNGKPMSNPNDAALNPVNWYGEVTLIDNYGSGSYDVVFIYSYDNYIVGSMEDRTHTIYDIVHNTQVTLGYNEGEDFDIYINGEKGTFSDIKQDSVASVFVAEDGYKLVYVCREILSGKIETISTSDSELTVDGVVYDVEDSSALAEAANHFGDKVTLYLDGAKRIAYIDFSVSSQGEQYAIITSLKTTEEENQLRVKLFSQDGIFKTMYITEKFKLNGKTVKLENGALGWQKLWDENVTDNRKLIKILAEADTIKEVETAEDTAYNDILNGNAYTGFRRVYQANTSNQLYYKTAGTHFVDMVISAIPVPRAYETDSSTLCFIMPDSVTADTSSYAMQNMGAFGNNERVAADMYRTNSSKSIDVMVIKGTESRTTNSSNILVVNKVTNVLNSDDEVVVSIEGVVNGKAGSKIQVKANDSFIIENNKTLEQYALDLNSGDVLTYRTNNNGEIIYFFKLFDKETETATLPASLTVDTAMAVYGKITGYKDGIVTIYDRTHDVELSYKYSGSVIVHDSTDNVQKVDTVAELVYGKQLCLYVQESRVRAAVVYQ